LLTKTKQNHRNLTKINKTKQSQNQNADAYKLFLNPPSYIKFTFCLRQIICYNLKSLGNCLFKLYDTRTTRSLSPYLSLNQNWVLRDRRFSDAIKFGLPKKPEGLAVLRTNPGICRIDWNIGEFGLERK
jgi:hypothetical protein